MLHAPALGRVSPILDSVQVAAVRNDFYITPRVMTPPMHTPGPSNAEPRPIPQGPLKTTRFEGPKTIETLRVVDVCDTRVCEAATAPIAVASHAPRLSRGRTGG